MGDLIKRSKIRGAERKQHSKQFKRWLYCHGYSAEGFAREYDLNPDTVRKWASGDRWNQLLLTVMRLADYKETHP